MPEVACGREICGWRPHHPAHPPGVGPHRYRGRWLFEQLALALGFDDLVPGVDPVPVANGRNGGGPANSAGRHSSVSRKSPQRPGRIRLSITGISPRHTVSEPSLEGSPTVTRREPPGGPQNQHQGSTGHRTAMPGPDR